MALSRRAAAAAPAASRSISSDGHLLRSARSTASSLAHSTAVLPDWSHAERSAPARSSTRSVVICPLAAARMSGVRPLEERCSTDALRVQRVRKER